MPKRRSDLDSVAQPTSRPRSDRSSTPPRDRVAELQLRKIMQNRGHFPSDEAMIKPLRITEIGLASGCVGPPQPSRRRRVLLLLRRAAKRQESR
jgi:hypothetical protein